MWEGIGMLNTGATLNMPIKDEYKNKSSLSQPYPMSNHKRKLLDPILDQLLEAGIIEDSQATQYSSPILLVVQKEKPRFVIDFRKINERTPLDCYPLPRQEDIFSAIEGSQYLSLLDITKAFYQMPIAREDRPKTTFITPHRGSYQLTRSVMGYLNSPAFCQRELDKLLGKVKWQFAVIYVDDIIVFSRSWTEHLEHLSWILSTLHRAGLKLDQKKAFLGFNSIQLLGHVVNSFGLQTQQSKIDAMTQLPLPKTVSELESQLGFFGYYRLFIENYAQVSHPLSHFLAQAKAAKEKSITLPEDCIAAIGLLKAKLANSVTRAHPKGDPNTPYVLYVDACKLGFGAALHIDNDPSSTTCRTEHPICFISRKLKKNETNYWPTELEAAGLVWALGKLEHIIEGHPLTIYTDHSALTWLFNATSTKTKHNQRLTLWALNLQKWKANCTIIHRPGQSHCNADVLSRFPVASEFPEEQRQIATQSAPPASAIHAVSHQIGMHSKFRKSLRDSYANDKHFSAVYKHMHQHNLCDFQNFHLSQGLLWLVDKKIGNRLAITDAVHKEVFESCHDGLGHAGFAKCYARLQSFYIPRLAARLRGYISSCPTCCTIRNKSHREGLLQPIDTPNSCFNTIAMDFVTGLPTFDGQDAILTITDKFSKMVTLIVCSTSDNARQTAAHFFRHFYCRFGLPAAIILDRDVRFTSTFWKALFSLINTRLLMSTAFHPQTDGLSERSNQTMENMLRAMIGYGLDERWPDKLAEIEFAINSSKHTVTGFSPFEVLYGFQPRAALDSLKTVEELTDCSNEAVRAMMDKRLVIQKEAADAIRNASATMARIYNSNRQEATLEVGDRVFIEGRANLRIPGHDNTKIGRRRFGPFSIIEKVGKSAFRLDLPQDYKMHDIINLQHLTKYPVDEYEREIARPPPLEEDAAKGDLYEVESVIDSRQHRGKTQYLAKFVGFPTSESLWYDEAESSSFSELVKQYKDRVAQGEIRRSAVTPAATSKRKKASRQS